MNLEPDSDLAGASVPALTHAPLLFEDYIHELVDVPVQVGLETIKVHIDYWRPDPASFVGADAALADAKVPVVVDAGPYFGSGKQGEDRRSSHYVHEWFFEHMIPRGYALAAVETPGTGGSTGCWDFMGPHEVAAMKAAVDWLGAAEWSNGKVGMIGKSYDAMTQIMALSEKPEALVTAVPVAPLTHAYAGIYMNGVAYDGFYGGAHLGYTVFIGMVGAPTHTPERMPGYAEKMPRQAACVPENWGMGLGNMGDYNDYYKQRDFRDSAKDVTVPVFYMQGFFDGAVHQDNAFPYVNDLAGPKMVWAGQWAHDYANATFAGRDDMYLTLERWFDHWMKDVDNGIEAELGFHIQDSQGRWRHEADWPPADTQPLRLFLTDGTLAPAASAANEATFADDGGHMNGAAMPVTMWPTHLAYTSAAFTQDTHVAGPVEVALKAASSGARGQVTVVLASCDATGEDCERVTEGAMNLVHRNGLDQPAPLTPNEAVTVTFTLQPRDYVFEEGRIAKVIIAGVDGKYFMAEHSRNMITVVEGDGDWGAITLPTVTRDADAFTFVGCGIYLKDLPCHDPQLRDRYPQV